jgi:hypothetical protein
MLLAQARWDEDRRLSDSGAAVSAGEGEARLHDYCEWLAWSPAVSGFM